MKAILVATLFTTFTFYFIKHFLNANVRELEDISCASPFRVYRTFYLLAAIIQPFLLRSFTDILSFLSIQMSVELTEQPGWNYFSRYLGYLGNDDFSAGVFKAFPEPASDLLSFFYSFDLSPYWLVIYLSYLAARTFVGMLFFHSTGFAFPNWFFHSSFYECSNGILIYNYNFKRKAISEYAN
jgi:hypothetical protein